MNVALLLEKAAAEGVIVKLENGNKLKACGPSEARGKWLPIFRQHKPELLTELLRPDRQTARPPFRQGGGGWRTNPKSERRDEVVVTIPAGDDPFETARTLIELALKKRDASELPAGRCYLFRLTDQRKADRRNAQAEREGATDRFCACGCLVDSAWPGHDGRLVWICQECAPTRETPQ